MQRLISAFLILVLLVTPTLAYADPPVGTTATNPPAAPLSGAVAVQRGEPAPVSGTILPEPTLNRVIELLSAGRSAAIQLEATTQQLAATRTQYIAQLTTCQTDVTQARQLAARNNQRGFFETYGTWIGLTLGLAVGIGATTAIVLAVRR